MNQTNENNGEISIFKLEFGNQQKRIQLQEIWDEEQNQIDYQANQKYYDGNQYQEAQYKSLIYENLNTTVKLENNQSKLVELNDSYCDAVFQQDTYEKFEDFQTSGFQDLFLQDDTNEKGLQFLYSKQNFNSQIWTKLPTNKNTHQDQNTMKEQIFNQNIEIKLQNKRNRDDNEDLDIIQYQFAIRDKKQKIDFNFYRQNQKIS